MSASQASSAGDTENRSRHHKTNTILVSSIHKNAGQPDDFIEEEF